LFRIAPESRAAADPNGRVWVRWSDADSGTLRLRRSNGSDTFGAVVSTSIPASQDAVYNLDLAARDDRVDVIVRTTKESGRLALPHAAFPGLSVKATSKRERVTVVVTDAGVPVAGSTVAVGGHLLHTGTDGRARAKVPNGTYRVAASKNKYVGARRRPSMRMQPPGRVRRGVWRYGIGK
jgi:hypothetical protein